MSSPLIRNIFILSNSQYCKNIHEINRLVCLQSQHLKKKSRETLFRIDCKLFNTATRNTAFKFLSENNPLLTYLKPIKLSRHFTCNVYSHFSSLKKNTHRNNSLILNGFKNSNRCEFSSYCLDNETGMELGKVVTILKAHAPTSLAENWDNVGLLVEPSSPHSVSTMLLTNDLTPTVLEEALEIKADFILSYHPPIFSSIKRLSQGKWKDRIIIRCVENRVAVYSPHTCYDAKAGGVNDWLIGAFNIEDVTPIHPTEDFPSGVSHKINILSQDPNKLQDHLSKLDLTISSSVGVTTKGDNSTMCTVLCDKSQLSLAIEEARECGCDVEKVETIQLEKVAVKGYGGGRLAVLKEPINLEQAVDCVKTHLKLDHVRLASKPGKKMIKSVAVCAGSGSSVLRGVRADLYLTGEMSHHDVLDAVYSGANVILCEHSNTERGYLHQVKEELSGKLDGVTIVVSSVDRDPLVVV